MARCTECGRILRGDLANIKGKDSVCYIVKPIRAIKEENGKQNKDFTKNGIRIKK